MGRKSSQAFDVEVGKRVRLRREAVGKSLPDVGAEIGITWQQVQKYEKGSDRISCSMLVEISRALGVHPSYFFETIETVSGPLVPKLDALDERIAREAAGLNLRQRRLVLGIVQELRRSEARISQSTESVSARVQQSMHE